jgi:hypothetical protein
MRQDPIPLTEIMPSLNHPTSYRSRWHCTEPISERDLRNADIQSVVAGTYSGGRVVSTVSFLEGEEVRALRKLVVRIIEQLSLSPIPIFDQTGKGVQRIGDDHLDADDFIRHIELLLFA